MNSITAGKLVFRHFPALAKFIRKNHLADYVKDLLEASRKADLPILKYLAHIPEEQLVEMGMQSHGAFLESVEENTLNDYLATSIKTWENDEMGVLGRDDLGIDDITKGSLVRKQVLAKYLRLYTDNMDEAFAIISDIDAYEAEAGTLATNTYIRILRKKIQEHAHFIESVTNTTPSIIYVYDIANRRLVYTNKQTSAVAGYSHEEIKEFSNRPVLDYVHPGDIEQYERSQQELETLADGAIKQTEYRIKNKAGNYHWIRAYEAVFKRNAEGAVIQKIGVAIDIDEQKQTEEQLKQREQQALEAQELAELGSFEFNVSTGVLQGTPQFYKIYELRDRAEMLKHVHPDDMKEVDELREEAIARNGSFDTEFRYKINGKEKVLWVRSLITFKDGEKLLKGTVMDITEHRRLVQQLEHSEMLYKQAQALSHIGSFSHDLTTNLINWTDEVYRIHGLEPQSTQITFDTVVAYMHPGDKDRALWEIQEAIRLKQPYDCKYRVLLDDGSVKVVHRKAEVIFDNDVPVSMNGTVQDITKEYFVEQELRENREFIEKIANTTPSLIASYNINTGRYTYINSAFEKILGYSAEKVMDEGLAFFMDIIHPDDLAPVMEKNNRALEEANHNAPADGQEMIVEFKYRLRHRDGHYRWFHTYGTIFDRNEKGLVEHILNVSVDITEQENAGLELHRKHIELQQSNASLEEYAYVASHDLKEPLRKIATFGDRLATTQQNRLTDDGKLYLEKIINSSRRMQAMISDLLSISMLSGDKVFEPYSLSAILNEVMQTLEFKIEEKKAVITSDELPVVNIIPSQFRQLFQNLVSNSLKFVTDGTPHIHIACRYLKPADVKQYDLVIAKKYLQLTVKDNGIGFDNQFSSKIFTIFQRLHGRSEYEGTGIGLSICKKVAENHGGTITAQSTPGHGATFTIIIPV